MNLSLLETAKQKRINGEHKLAQAFYERAINEGVPSDIVTLRKITSDYILFPLDFTDADNYFDLLFKLKHLSNNNDYKEEYIKAINSLLNIKTLFLREISLYYFSELAICYGNSLIVKNIYELFVYIHKNIDDIVDKDCYEIKVNIPNANMKQFKIDLLKIKAFCLNILLSYTAAQDSQYTGTTYHAHTYDYGWYSSTSISSTDDYATWAIIKPRLNMIGLDAYYNEYLEEYKATVNEINKYITFNSPKELRNEIVALGIKKGKKGSSESNFYILAKRFSEHDISRMSFLSVAEKFNYLYWLSKPFKKRIYKKSDVGSFELKTYFTRKKIWGVCDMISCGSHWHIDTVRWLMVGFFMFGVPIYLILGLAMSLGFYLPNITIEKP